ncbi:hypothetical protein O181_046352 [Austropuccinia psidii MF-1]|uniref:Uncharacterized protein n=1 Tax=Austropuccinia psidii MF-1 TaxID=1389203 RepID=A0A9Q3HJK9_9BASI|nr:hypothetical protein [Austropuccinia psidii MF-1]
MWKRACDTAAKCIDEAKEHRKQRYEKTHQEPDFEEGHQVPVSTLNLNNLKGPKKVRRTEEFSRKHPLFPMSLVKPYFQTGEDTFPPRIKTYTPKNIVEVEESPGPVKKIIKARKIRLNRKYQRQYLVRLKNETADKDKWLAEDAIPDGNLHLIQYRASRRAKQSQK